MKEMERLQESLKKLPKYSLKEEQREEIIRALKGEMKRKKGKLLLKPVFVFILMCMTMFALMLASDSNSWLQELKLSLQPQLALNAPEAIIFKNNDYNVIGIKGKLGILVTNEQFVAKDTRRGSKLMLYFWGDASKLVDKHYRVEAVNRKNEKITLSEGILYAPLHNEDAHTLTSFTPFPMEGDWQLSFFVEDQLFEAFTIEVLPPFPETKDYSLLSHPMELAVDKEMEIIIESTVESEKGIEVKLLNKHGSVVSEDVFVRDGTFIANSGGYIYHYQGQLEFPERGTWRLVIDGEETKPFEN